MSFKNASATIPTAPRKGRKYFTVAEANRALPYVSRIVGEITHSCARVNSMSRQLERDGEEGIAREVRDDYERSVNHLSSLLDELHQVGVQLKDSEKGLVDFPAVHEGREIYLCWQLGEQHVLAWHELDAGYAGRQDVSCLDGH